jgi:hypothetical protein
MNSVVSGWQQHTVSSIREPGKNFVAMNKEGIKQGCTDSKVHPPPSSKSPISIRKIKSKSRLKKDRSFTASPYPIRTSPMAPPIGKNTLIKSVDSHQECDLQYLWRRGTRAEERKRCCGQHAAEEW